MIKQPISYVSLLVKSGRSRVGVRSKIPNVRFRSSNVDLESFKYHHLNMPTIGRTVCNKLYKTTIYHFVVVVESHKTHVNDILKLAEQEFLYLQQPDMPENPRILKVSVLGTPNAGKSTLVNRLMNRRVDLSTIASIL